MTPIANIMRAHIRVIRVVRFWLLGGRTPVRFDRSGQMRSTLSECKGRFGTASVTLPIGVQEEESVQGVGRAGGSGGL